MTLDAIDLELRWKLLIAVLAEAALTVVRTSFSKIVTEGGDFGCLLYDRHGRMVAQDAGVSSKLGVAPRVVRAILDRYGEHDIAPGDVFVTNDPWLCAGHLYDLAVVSPIYHLGRLVAFAEALAHLPDIGGSLTNDTRDVYEEGLSLPVVRLIARGRPVAELWDVIRANVRIPDQIEGDVNALIAALDIIGSRIREHLDQYGGEFDALAEEIIGTSARALTHSIETLIEPGVYAGSAEIDGFDDEATSTIRLRVDAQAGRLSLDFTGTAPQSARAINCTEAYSTAWALYAVRCLFGVAIPYNKGLMLPVGIHIPRRTLLNADHPAPVRMKSNAGNFVPYAVFDALATAMPERVMAQSGGKCTVRGFARGPCGAVAETFQFMGGFGARARKHGIPCLAFPASGAETPVELIERSIPLTVLNKVLVRGSGGIGKFSGGDGQRVTLRGDSDSGVRLLVQNMRTRKPASGYAGGGNGATGRNALNGQPIPGKTSVTLMRGDVLELQVSAGGGYGVEDAPAGPKVAER